MAVALASRRLFFPVAMIMTTMMMTTTMMATMILMAMMILIMMMMAMIVTMALATTSNRLLPHPVDALPTLSSSVLSSRPVGITICNSIALSHPARFASLNAAGAAAGKVGELRRGLYGVGRRLAVDAPKEAILRAIFVGPVGSRSSRSSKWQQQQQGSK